MVPVAASSLERVRPNLVASHCPYVARYSIERKDSGLYEVPGTHMSFMTLPDQIDHFKRHPIQMPGIHTGNSATPTTQSSTLVSVSGNLEHILFPVPSHCLDNSSLLVEDTPLQYPLKGPHLLFPFPTLRTFRERHSQHFLLRKRVSKW